MTTIVRGTARSPGPGQIAFGCKSFNAEENWLYKLQDISTPYLFLNNCQSISQHSISRGLAAKRHANNHKTVTDYHHLVDLLYFLQEEIGALEISSLASLSYSLVKYCVVRFRQLYSREKI